MKIGIIDYGMGNIHSVINCFSNLKTEVQVVKEKNKLEDFTSFILPGVGAYPMAMKNLLAADLVDEIKKQILIKKKPILGICLGMQLFLEKAHENEECEGFSFIKGEVDQIEIKKNYPVPIVGWHKVKFYKKNNLFKNIDKNSFFYFDHSYHCIMNSKSYKIAKISYSSEICASFQKKNIYGVQFHPEKSQINGLKLIRNFINLSLKY